jgi:hypothetical protein
MTKALSFGSDGKLLEFVPQISDMSGLQNSLDGKANLSGGNTLTGTQTFRAAATQDSIKIAGRAGGTSSYSTTITPLALSANRTLSAPDADGTIATLSAQTFTGAQRMPNGSVSACGLSIGQAGTGIFYDTTSVLSFAANGNQVLRIANQSNYVDAYNADCRWYLRRSNGTQAAPTKVLSDDLLGTFGAQGWYDDGAGSSGMSNNGIGMRVYATEDRNSASNLGVDLRFYTIPNGEATSTFAFKISQNQTLIVAGNSSYEHVSSNAGAINAKLQMLGLSIQDNTAFLQARFDATAGDCPLHTLAKSRGTTTTDFTAVAANDTLGIIAAEGSDGTQFIRAGSIRFYVDGTVSTGIVPGRIEFYTNNASGTATKAVTIDSSQNMKLASTTDATDKDTGSIVTEGGIASEKTQFSQTGHNVANKFRMHYDSTTGEYGPQFRLTNRTGSNTVKGTIVRASTANDMAFETEAADEDEPIGIVYQDGVANGSDAWVWGSGAVAQVLLVNSTAATRGYWAAVGSADGRADMTNANPIVANHWREIGHCLESKTAGTNVLARAIIHFN